MNRRKPGRPPGTFRGAYPASVNHKQTKAYRKYNSMLARCYRPSHPSYERYKSLGVTVCERWRGRGGFSNFIIDMGIPPEGLTLERKDNNKGYSPDNCVWATWKQQASNRGEKRCQPNSLWSKAKTAGLPYHVVYQRIKKFGWSESEALSAPVMRRGGSRGNP